MNKKMNKQELEFILQEGEGYKVEFKEKLANVDKDIVAFANAGGGKIFVGVGDEGKVRGVDVDNRIKSEIQTIARNCDPPVEIKLEIFENILIVHVEEGNDKPYKCKEGFYMRIGTNSQKMKRDEIVRMVIGERRIRFDELINKEFDFKRDFDEEKFRSFLKENSLFGDLETKDVLISLNLAAKKEREIFMNNAGVLFFAKNPPKFFLNAYLDCVLFKGKDRSDVIDRKTFRLGLFEQLSSAKEFVKKHLNLSYNFKEFERKEEYEIPLRAIEEAVVNALMHRDYFLKGANISLFIYNDRLEIISPGGLPRGLDKSNFGKLSVRRNQIIADIFSKTPYVEQIGSGISRMRNLLRKANLPAPKFEMDGFFIVVFRRKEPLKGPEKEPLKGPENRQEKIIEFVGMREKVKRNEIIVGLAISLGTLKKDIAKLVSKGAIKRIGSDKTGYYVLNREQKENEKENNGNG